MNKPKITKRFILQRKADGLYYNPRSKWSKSRGWTDDATKAKLYVNSGHARNSHSFYVPWNKSQSEAERVAIRREKFDALYTIITIEVSLNAL